MISGRVSPAAWLACLASVMLGAASIVFTVLNGYSFEATLNEAPLIEVAFTFPVVGAVIASHHPRNAVGWIFLLVGFTQGLILFTFLYAEHAYLIDPGSLPSAHLAAWLSSWMWLPGFGSALTFLPLLFPTGRPPSRRWRPVAWLSGMCLGVLVLVVATGSWSLTGKQLLGEVEVAGFAPLLLLLLACGLASAASLVARFRASRREERQQLKWFVLAVCGLVVLFVLDGLQIPVGAGNALAVILIPCIPAAVGVGMLRYRLYDIDRIINRTLVYGALTAFLGALYSGAVVVLQAAVGERIGSSPLAVAATTLAVAALFRPARALVQTLIDRRFNRSTYDAQKTVEAFSGRLRDEVDLDQLSSDLVAVVRTTVQPAHASLWLRPAGETRELPGGSGR